MATLKLATTYTRMFLMVQSSDHITGLTGASPTVNIAKAGAGFQAAAGLVQEMASGWYKVSLTVADTGVLGDLAYHITAASADPTDFIDQVCANILGDTLPSDVQSVGTGVITESACDDTFYQGFGNNHGLSATFSGSVVDSVLSQMTTVTVGGITDKTGFSLTSAYDFAKGTVAMNESKAADGATMTPAQAFYMIWTFLTEFSISGTTYTSNKIDGVTPNMTFTLNGSSPSGITRAS